MARRNRPIYCAALLAYTALACAATYPLVLHLSSAVPHDLGDPILSTTLLWWNAHTRPLTDQWWNGFAFWPAHGTLAFSDHRLGESLLATPAQWIGLTPIAAYNLTLLATFPLSALAAHWAAFTLTRRHDAALLAGLAYGFNPYRIAHIEHLELLAGFGMAAALASLHLFAETRRRRWLVALFAATVLQALCSSYYVAAFAVVALLWTAWFARDWALRAAIAATLASAAAAMTPIVLRYLEIHRFYGMARDFNDMVTFSGDMTSLATASPLLTFWGWTAALNGPERQLFPGVTIAALAACGAIAALRVATTPGARMRRVSLTFALLAGAFLVDAAAAALVGGWSVTLLGVTIASHVASKPLTLALGAAAAAGATTARGIAAFRSRSALAFYLCAAGILFLCSFGPQPTFLGHPVLYKPPYAWLMELPIFGGSLRAPARFAMSAALMLSMAGALAFARLTASGARPAITAALALAIFLDAWAVPLPMASPPVDWSPVSAAAAIGPAATLELPLGDYDRDAAAMYRAGMHGVPTVNGYSGYEPRHYGVLRLALEERDETVLDALASRGPLLVASDKRTDPHGYRDQWLRAHARTACVGETDDWSLFDLRGPQHAVRIEPPPCGGGPLPIVAARDDRGAIDVASIADGNRYTFWMTRHPQRAGDRLVLDVGDAARLCTLKLSLGAHPELFPRVLTIDTSATGSDWVRAFAGKTGGRAVLAALDHPESAWIDFPLPHGTRARYVRLTLGAGHPLAPWIVADAIVTGAR